MFLKRLSANVFFFSILHANTCTGTDIDGSVLSLPSEMSDGTTKKLRGKVFSMSKEIVSLTDGEFEGIKKKKEVIKSKEYVLLKNYHSGRRLYAQNGYNFDEGFGAVSADKPTNEDQYWYLQETSCDLVYAKCYYLYNKLSNRRLYAAKGKDWEEGVGASSSTMYEDQIWWFEITNCGGKECFYIVNELSGRRLYAQKGKNFDEGIGAKFDQKEDDQKWYIG